MDTLVDGNENLFLLAPIFSLAQKWGGGGKEKLLFVGLVVLLYKLVPFYLIASQLNQ